MALSPSAASGFSYLELLVAAFVLATFAIGITGLYMVSIRTGVDAERQVVALGIANEHIERIRTLSAASAGQVPPLETVGRNGLSYAVKTAAVPSQGDILGRQTVKVEVSWQSAAGVTRSIRLVTSVAPDLPLPPPVFCNVADLIEPLPDLAVTETEAACSSDQKANTAQVQVGGRRECVYQFTFDWEATVEVNNTNSSSAHLLADMESKTLVPGILPNTNSCTDEPITLKAASGTGQYIGLFGQRPVTLYYATADSKVSPGAQVRVFNFKPVCAFPLGGSIIDHPCPVPTSAPIDQIQFEPLAPVP